MELRISREPKEDWDELTPEEQTLYEEKLRLLEQVGDKLADIATQITTEIERINEIDGRIGAHFHDRLEAPAAFYDFAGANMLQVPLRDLRENVDDILGEFFILPDDEQE